jgi:ATP-dependent RNA/DNA helicase IGHMBP2
MTKVHEEVVNDLQKLLTLIEKERHEEYIYYFEHLARLPVQQKVKEGVSWYPAHIKDTGFGLGDYPFIKVENKNTDISHQFSSGKQVKVYNSADDREFITGSVYFVDGNTMKIVFMIDELPDWVEDCKLAVDVLFDDKTFKEMEKAVKTVMNAKNCRLAELANICYGYGKPELIREEAGYYKNELLNDSQNAAVNAIIQTQDLALVHGPPGTGKTTTLVSAIQEMVKRGEQILVCTPSNAAADHIAVELGYKEINVVRIGNVARVSADLLKYTVEGLLENHSRQKELTDYRWRALEYRRMASKYKRNFGFEERKQRDLLYKEARALSSEARLLEDYMVSDILRMAQVVVTTLVGVESRYLEGRNFKTVIIDEAAQALEPATWIPICRAEKVIMAGDPFQLPPTVKSMEAAKGGLSFTLMERCMKTQPESAHLLNVQYRMNADIMEFSNLKFYEGKLKAHETVANRRLQISDINTDPIEFIDTAGCGFEEIQDAETRSLYNEGEVKILLQHLEEWEQIMELERPPSIAIISPYRQQVRKMEEKLKLKGGHYNSIKINTVDAFQGQERDIIYISLVRSNNNGDIGFLKDYRRMNVAMTRAKKKLIIIGDSATLSNDRFYADFLEFADKKGFYKTAWDLPVYRLMRARPGNL